MGKVLLSFLVVFSPLWANPPEEESANEEAVEEFQNILGKGMAYIERSNFRNIFSIIDRSLGDTVPLGRRWGFGYGGGFKWMKLSLGETHYGDLDFAPLFLTTIMAGPEIGGHLRLDLDRDGEKFFYLGSSVGFMRIDSKHSYPILGLGENHPEEEAYWSPVTSFDAGIVVPLVGSSLSLDIGYEFMNLHGTDGPTYEFSPRPYGGNLFSVVIVHVFGRR